MGFFNFKGIVMEFVGTFFLVYFSGWAYEWRMAKSEDLFGLAVANGTIYAVFTYIAKPFSAGHFNPVITVCTTLAKEIHLVVGIFYVCSQLFASILAALFLDFLKDHELERASRGQLGFPKLANNISQSSGFFIEMIGTAILVFCYYNAGAHRKSTASEDSAIITGMLYTILTLAIGNATGCGLNPARVLGPVIITNQQVYLSQNWLYWVGPFTGGLSAFLVYAWLGDKSMIDNMYKLPDIAKQLQDGIEDYEDDEKRRLARLV